MKRTHIEDLKPGDTVRGTVHLCAYSKCRKAFIGRRDAEYCSDKCRLDQRYEQESNADPSR